MLVKGDHQEGILSLRINRKKKRVAKEYRIINKVKEHVIVVKHVISCFLMPHLLVYQFTWSLRIKKSGTVRVVGRVREGGILFSAYRVANPMACNQMVMVITQRVPISATTIHGVRNSQSHPCASHAYDFMGSRGSEGMGENTFSKIHPIDNIRPLQYMKRTCPR